jgi:hypothetical protein
MHFRSFSLWLEQVTQPEYPYYHPIQVGLFASLSYVSTACLTSIPPVRGATLTVSAYLISQLTAPLFCEFFKPYQEIPLIPLIGQVLQWTTSLILAKVMCRIAGQVISFKEMRQIGLGFLMCLYIARWALFKFRQQLHPT